MSPAKSVPKHRIVVDGSNLATEGRTTPSLTQLDEAVRAYLDENPKADVIVVVDASFEHRVAPSERDRFKQAELAGEIVTPPAGAVGRGDAFILKIAARIGAIVLSNDSFQEFHEEHPWLFEEGRLIGGKPVPGVGWVFTARLPVRGAKSARAAKKLTVRLPGGVTPTIGATITPVAAKPAKAPTKTARAAKKSPVKVTVEKPPPKPAKAAKAPLKATDKEVASRPKAETPPKRARAAKKSPAKVEPTKIATPVAKAPAKKAVSATTTKKAARGRAATTALSTPAGKLEPAVALRRGRQPVNPEGEFANFVAAHRVRSHVDGEVVAFTSHGAIIAVTLASGESVECYAPTTLLASPPPARARDVLKRGDRRSFRLVSVDRDRRIAELALL